VVSDSRACPFDLLICGGVSSRISRRRPAIASLLAVVILASLLFAVQPPTSSAGVAERDADRRQLGLARTADAVQRSIRGCTNQKRIRHGLPPLAPAAPLEAAASLHASSMKKNGFFGHVDPRGRDATDRVGLFARKSRYTPIGENIAAGFGSARRVCKLWMKSPSHRANILNPDFTVIGAGFARGGQHGTYYVQVFGRKG